MKRFVRLLSISLAAPLLLAVAAWTACRLYWHFKILNAIDVADKTTGGTRMGYIDHREEYRPFREAGCRQLPYLIRAMENPASGELHWDLLYHYFGTRAAAEQDPEKGKALSEAFMALDTNPIRLGDPVEQRQARVRRLREWWASEGHLYHQWWRVWSSTCGS
jgi:hypothetical protein